MVVPRFVEQALRGEEITVYGDGDQRRVFCDVSDAVRGILALAEHDGAVGRVFNIGGEEEISILELAERIREVTESASPIVKVAYEDAYAPGFEDMQRRLPSTDRMRKLTGWAPSVSLSDILTRITEHERRRLADAAPDSTHRMR